jgi:hypothetical protein
MILAWKGPLGFNPVSAPKPRHRLEAYAMLHCSPEGRAISRNASPGEARAPTAATRRC